MLYIMGVLLPTWVFAQSSMYIEEIEQYVVTPCLQARMHAPGPIWTDRELGHPLSRLINGQGDPCAEPT